MAIAPADWRVEHARNIMVEFWLHGFIPTYRRVRGLGGPDCSGVSSVEVDAKICDDFTVELMAHDGYTLLSVWVTENVRGSKDKVHTCLVDRVPMPDTPEEAINLARFALRLARPSLGRGE